MLAEQDAYLILNAVCRLSRMRICRLIDHFGSAVGLLQAGWDGCRDTGLARDKDLEEIFSFKQDEFLKKESARCQEEGISILTLADANYPEMLRQLFMPPFVLYIKGQLPRTEALNLAIVGSRKASEYGRAMATHFAENLALKGVAIISGLARGIDTAAHEGCLAGRGQTWAVLGSGLCCLYPRENKGLAARIVQQGALVSEFPMDTKPLPYHFPQRNRIISGLSSGVLVVEAAKRSGALSTSRHALEQGRDVFAIPGNINQTNSMGTNQLIQQGAKPVMSPDDVLEEYLSLISTDRALPQGNVEEISKKDNLGLSQIDLEVYNRIPQASIGIDALAESCQLEIPRLLKVLFELELKQQIRRLPGQRIIKTEQALV